MLSITLSTAKSYWWLWQMDARSFKITHVEHLFGTLCTSIFKFSLFVRLSIIHILCVAVNNMHIYAFIVLHMHKIAFKHIFGLHMQIFTHIYAYFHTSCIPYTKIPHSFRHCIHNMHTKHYGSIVTDTRVPFLYLARLQGNINLHTFKAAHTTAYDILL